jgi:hypothetical protein
MATTCLSLSEARRLAIAAQGFGPRPARPGVAHLRALAAKIHAFQIDSVNVLARAHYVPAFARLGPYSMATLDVMTYRTRELFEYWGHAACLMPIALYPLLRYRMQKHADETERFMKSTRGVYMTRALAEVAERGPISAAELTDPGKRSGKWWAWGVGKATLEHLFEAGLVAIAGRRGFERLYDLSERVIPRRALEAPPPPREVAMKALIVLGAQACGVGTFTDITNYLNVDDWRDRLPAGPCWMHPKGSDARRRSKPIIKRLVSELVEEKRLLPVRVEGWRDEEPTYLHPDARLPRTVDARGIVTAFDSLVWERERIDRLFGMKYTIEMYTPPPKRTYGYYVCPFLLGDTLVARCDLKADRQRKVLMVQSAFLEPGQRAPRVAPDLAAELRHMQAWLQLERIEIADRGDLAPGLRRSLRSTGSRRAKRNAV